VAKWRKRPVVLDARVGPEPVSTVLSTGQEAIAVAFRRHMLLALDDCLYALQATIPHRSRSALHRCFQRHGISRLPLSEDGQSLHPQARSLQAVSVKPSFCCLFQRVYRLR